MVGSVVLKVPKDIFPLLAFDVLRFFKMKIASSRKNSCSDIVYFNAPKITIL